MAGIFGDVLKGFLGSDYLKDYRHANKIFTSAGYANSPRLKYLFHVYFNLNTGQVAGLNNIFGFRDKGKISVLTKSVELPKYSFDVQVMNQYNRKRNVQTRINYEPINIEFHDDSSDVVRSLWYAYYDYFYKDPSQPYGGNQAVKSTTNLNAGSAQLPFEKRGFDNNGNGQNDTVGVQGDQNKRDIYQKYRVGNDWGYKAEGTAGASSSEKPQFFRDITIYGFNQKSYVSYTLINPIITDFQHDRYDYAQSAGIMQNSMTLRYESVKYGEGAIGKNGVPGFAEPQHYDNSPSALSRPGSTDSFLGQGGILDAGVGVFEDLAQGDILGAATKAGRVIMNKDNISLKGIKEEVINETRKVVAQGIAANAINNSTAFFPTQKTKKSKADTNQPLNSQNVDIADIKNKSDIQLAINRGGDPATEGTNNNPNAPIVEVDVA